MRRILVFGFLGPAMSFLVVALLADLGGAHVFAQWQFFLGIVYGLALIPSLLCAWLDHQLAQATPWRRIATVATIAALMTLTVVLFISGLTGNAQLQVLMFGLAGALPAAVCSWLSSMVN